jgi:uncharacterized phage protein (TIGR02216 family)
MHAGLGVLGLAPREFWATTPREIAAAFAAADTAAAPARRDLDDLMQLYPDTP